MIHSFTRSFSLLKVWVLLHKLRWLAIVFPRLSNARYNCLSDVSIVLIMQAKITWVNLRDNENIFST